MLCTMGFKKILAAVNGSKTDEEVVQLACALAMRNKAKVFVTYVIELDRSLPLDAEDKSALAKGEQALDTAENCAGQCDYEISTDLLQARAVGPAIVNEAAERGADLIIMGMDYKTRFGEFSMGDISPYVLKHAPCRVLLLREPMTSTVVAPPKM